MGQAELIADAGRAQGRHAGLRVERELVDRRAITCRQLGPAAHHEGAGARLTDPLAIVGRAERDARVDGAGPPAGPELQAELDRRCWTVRRGEFHLGEQSQVWHDASHIEARADEWSRLV